MAIRSRQSNERSFRWSGIAQDKSRSDQSRLGRPRASVPLEYSRNVTKRLRDFAAFGVTLVGIPGDARRISREQEEKSLERRLSAGNLFN